MRLDLLDRNLSAEQIDAVMRAASPRRSVSWRYLLGGLAICATSIGIFALEASRAAGAGESFSWRLPALLGAFGAGVVARGLVR